MRKQCLVGAALTTLTLLFAGCASGGSDSDSGAGSGEIDTNGVVNAAYSVPPSSLDPHRAASHTSLFTYGALVYDRLAKIDAEGMPAPMLAESWEFSEDGLALDFRLRDGVTFSDGAALDAEAVKESLDRAAFDPESTVASQFPTLTEVVVVDPMTVRLVTSRKTADLPYTLTGMPGAIISPDAIDNADLDVSPVGSGPYVLKELRQGDSASFDRRDDYWGPEEGLPKTFNVIGIPDDNARLNALRSGQLDVAQVYPNSVDKVEALGPGFDLHPFALSTGLGASLNQEFEQLADPRVRQALNYAIDRDAISEQIYNGTCEPTSQALIPGMVGHMKSPPVEYTHDVEKARSLLAEAGYANGLTLRMIVIQGVSIHETLATALQAQLADIGVEVEIVKMDATQAPGQYATGAYDSYVHSIQGSPSPIQMLAAAYAPGRFFIGDLPADFIDPLTAANDPTVPDDESTASLETAASVANEQAFDIIVCAYPTQVVINDKIIDVDQMYASNYQGYLDLREVSVASE